MGREEDCRKSKQAPFEVFLLNCFTLEKKQKIIRSTDLPFVKEEVHIVVFLGEEIAEHTDWIA